MNCEGRLTIWKIWQTDKFTWKNKTLLQNVGYYKGLLFPGVWCLRSKRSVLREQEEANNTERQRVSLEICVCIFGTWALTDVTSHLFSDYLVNNTGQRALSIYPTTQRTCSSRTKKWLPEGSVVAPTAWPLLTEPRESSPNSQTMYCAHFPTASMCESGNPCERRWKQPLPLHPEWLALISWAL